MKDGVDECEDDDDAQGGKSLELDRVNARNFILYPSSTIVYDFWDPGDVGDTRPDGVIAHTIDRSNVVEGIVVSGVVRGGGCNFNGSDVVESDTIRVAARE